MDLDVRSNLDGYLLDLVRGHAGRSVVLDLYLLCANVDGAWGGLR
jgi:hypothetical protein